MSGQRARPASFFSNRPATTTGVDQRKTHRECAAPSLLKSAFGLSPARRDDMDRFHLRGAKDALEDEQQGGEKGDAKLSKKKQKKRTSFESCRGARKSREF